MTTQSQETTTDAVATKKRVLLKCSEKTNTSKGVQVFSASLFDFKKGETNNGL